MSTLILILGLVLFVGLVVVHEFGHFIMARRNGVEVEEFGIGFPPRAKVLGTKNGTTYTLNWLPLGGFVKLKGENDSATATGSFGAASLSAKIQIMLAGVVMNLLTAFVMITFLAVIGIPKLIDGQFTIASDTKIVQQDVLVGFVEAGSPAGLAGLTQRDQLISFNDANQQIVVNNAENLPNITKQFAGKTVNIEIKRSGKNLLLPITLRNIAEVEASKSTENPKGYLGIVPSEYIIQRSTWSSPLVAAGLIRQVSVLTLKGLGTAVASLIKGDTAKASSQVAGPVGIFVLLKDGTELGFRFILIIIAIISLTLALMNALPIPALDGGRLFVTLLYRAMRKPLTKKAEDLIHGTGFALLMVLFFVITYVDVNRFT